MYTMYTLTCQVDFPPPPADTSELSEESVGQMEEENKENIVKQVAVIISVIFFVILCVIFLHIVLASFIFGIIPQS